MKGECGKDLAEQSKGKDSSAVKRRIGPRIPRTLRAHRPLTESSFRADALQLVSSPQAQPAGHLKAYPTRQLVAAAADGYICGAAAVQMKDDIETLKHAIQEGEEQQARNSAAAARPEGNAFAAPGAAESADAPGTSSQEKEEAQAALVRLEECRKSGWKLCPTVIR